MSRTDVLIIGGGPAGLATAIELRRKGLEVVVVDRAEPEIDKPCGEGLMPDGVVRLGQMGIEVAPDQRAPIHGIRYVDGERSAEARFQQGCGLGIRRPVLHRAMVQRAAETGVVMKWKTGVEGLSEAGARTSRGNLEAEWTIGADGLRSRVRAWAGLEAPSRATRRFGVRRHYARAPWSDLVEVHWAEGCEAYVTPVSSDRVGVAVLWSGLKAGFDDLLPRFPELVDRLDGSRVVSRDRGTGPLDQRVRGVYRDRVALVGDAAGYRDAITGEGISLAFHQAAALAEAIAAGDLASYQATVRRLTRLPFALIRLLLIAERRPWLRRRLIETLAREPALFARLLAVHARQRSPREIGPGLWMRLARGLLTG